MIFGNLHNYNNKLRLAPMLELFRGPKKTTYQKWYFYPPSNIMVKL